MYTGISRLPLYSDHDQMCQSNQLILAQYTLQAGLAVLHVLI